MGSGKSAAWIGLIHASQSSTDISTLESSRIPLDQMTTASYMRKAGALIDVKDSGRLSGNNAMAKVIRHTTGPRNAKSRGSSQNPRNSGTLDGRIRTGSLSSKPAN